MGVRAWIRPTGPLPASVYWLRRAALSLPLLLVVVVIAIATRGGARHTATPPAGTSPLAAPTTPRADQTPTPTDTSTPTSTSTSTPTATTTAVSPACPAGDLAVAVTTTSRGYASGTDARFTATLRNSGPACSAAGPLSLVVTSGSDRVWGSADCATTTGRPTVLAAAGSSAAVRSWDRTRTRPGCAPVLGTRTAQAGTYRVTATWAGVTSPPAVFTLD